MFDIIMPVSKRHTSCFEIALKSIQRQTIEDFHATVVGDGFNPYDCLVDMELKTDSRFTHWGTDSEEGIWGATPRNFGLNKTTGRRFLCYLDADNEWLPHHLQHCLDSMRDVDVFCSGFYAVDTLGNCVEITSDKSELGRIDTNGMCLDRKYVDDHDIVWEPRDAHDFILFDRLTRKYRWKVGNTPTYIYRCFNRNMVDFIKYGIENNA